MSTQIEIIHTGKRVFLPTLQLEIKGKTSMLGKIDALPCTDDEVSLIEPLFHAKNTLIPTYLGYVEQCSLSATEGAAQEKELYLVKTVSVDSLSKTEIQTESLAFLSTDAKSIKQTVQTLTRGMDVSCLVTKGGQVPEESQWVRKNESHARNNFLVDASIRGNKIKQTDIKSLETLSNVLFILQKRLLSDSKEEALALTKELKDSKKWMGILQEELKS